jgi:hypothetical protein
MLTDRELDEMAARDFRGERVAGETAKLVAEVRRLRAAIDAEREECARIAEQCSVEAEPGDVMDPAAFHDGAEQTGRMIAARIRTRRMQTKAR